MWQTMSWIIVLAILGVLFAFPFKRRFINDEQQPFPEGRAAGIVMDSLHHGDAAAGLLKAKLLVIFGGLAARRQVAAEREHHAYLKLAAHAAHSRVPGRLALQAASAHADDPGHAGHAADAAAGARPADDRRRRTDGHSHRRLDHARGGHQLRHPGADHDPAAATSCRTPTGTIGFREITFWSLWCGVAMMTVASLLAFFAKPQILSAPSRKLFGRAAAERGRRRARAHRAAAERLADRRSAASACVVVWMAHDFFGVESWLSASWPWCWSSSSA